MSVLAHAKVTLRAIPQLCNRPITVALLDQCVNYYYSNWPFSLKGCKRRESNKGGLAHLLPLVRQEAIISKNYRTKMGWLLHTATVAKRKSTQLSKIWETTNQILNSRCWGKKKAIPKWSNSHIKTSMNAYLNFATIQTWIF